MMDPSSREACPTDLTVELEGVFDLPAAKRVERLLEGAGRGRTVRVDLTRVREFQDLGLAFLAQALTASRASRVALRGLRLHQARMLRYFGVDPERFGWRAAGA